MTDTPPNGSNTAYALCDRLRKHAQWHSSVAAISEAPKEHVILTAGTRWAFEVVTKDGKRFRVLAEEY